MKKQIFTFVLCVSCLMACSQTYQENILNYRKKFISELLADPKKPISPADVRFIKYYEPDSNYRVTAIFEETPGMQPFMIPTHSGKQKPFVQCGLLKFTIHDTDITLHCYQMLNLTTGQPANEELFVPFNDLTNYVTTYAGGRYIDLTPKDFDGHKCFLDFNKCYNPYCAYGGAFSCPIPPEENRLHVAIMAGEKMFAKNME